MLPSSGRRFAARAMSGTELSRVPTELRLLPPEAYQQKSDRVERRRHCYAIKCPKTSESVENRVAETASGRSGVFLERFGAPSKPWVFRDLLLSCVSYPALSSGDSF